MNILNSGNYPSETPSGIIGIGASAGSLNALKTLFGNLTSPRGLSYIVVTHLSPDQKSHLGEILQASTELPVVSVEEDTALLSGHIYVITPGKNLAVTQTHLHLSKLEDNRRDRAPINHLFKSLAEAYGSKCAGIILTGVGSDGSLGIKEIKAHGGLTIVQDPEDAKFDGMPVSAIRTGLVDIILPLKDIGSYINHIFQIFTTNPQKYHLDSSAIEYVVRKTRHHSGKNLGLLKSGVLSSHIIRRMQVCQLQDIRQYMQLIQTDPQELKAFVDTVLVSVTSFFRQTDRVAYLKSGLVPYLLLHRDTIKVWSVGCSTGEEAYSFAMLILEEATRLAVHPNVKIIATDLHGPSLQKAREGIFSLEIENEISEERLHRFFKKEGETYRISEEIRNMVEFSYYSYLDEPPVSNVDIVTCTNVFGQLTEQSASDLLDIFYYVLSADGTLLVDEEKHVSQSAIFVKAEENIAAYHKQQEDAIVVPAHPEQKEEKSPPAVTPALDHLFHCLDEGTCLIEVIFDKNDVPVDYRFLEVNSEFELQTGLKNAQGKTMRELVPDHEEYWFQIYGRVATTGKAEKFEQRAENLGQRWYKVHACPVGASGSNLVGIIFRDISHEKKTEAALKEREVRYRELFNSMEEGFCIMDVLFDEHNAPYDYRFLEVNPAFSKQTGLVDAEGKTALELVPDLEKYWIDTYGRIALTGERLHLVQRSDAMGRWFEIEGFRVGGEGSTEVALLFTDITKRVEVERALKESEARFRTFADTAPATLWVTNAKGECTFISQGWTEITGMSQPNALQYGWLDAVHPDDFDGIKAEFIEHNRHERAFRLEYRLRLKDNTYHWVIDAGKPNRDSEGRFLGYVGSIIDIDHRKKVEEALRENENLIKITLEQLPVGVNISSAPEGRLLFQNNAAKEIVGHKLIETENISGFSKYHAIHADGTPYKPGDYPLVKAIKGKVTQQEEMLYRKGDGSLITLIVNSSPVRDENNKIVRAVSAFQDITELRRAQEAVMLSEAHLKLILESATDYAIFTMDLDLRITDWNAGAEQILGYAKEEVIGEEGNIILIPEEKESKLLRKVKIARQQGKAESEGWYVRKDGNRFYGRGTLMPLRVKGEDFLGYLKIMVDYSERREIEDALREAKEEAEKASYAKDEFLAHMSHEIRTPLNAIIGLSNLLIQRNKESSITQDLQTVKFSADNLRMLVDDILDFSKIQAGKVEIEHTPVNLRLLLQNLEKAHVPRAGEQHNQLQLKFAEDIPDCIYTDSLRLSQVINNLLSNAIKFTENGLVQLETKLHKREGNKAWVEFIVSDTGCGIPEDKQSVIFEKFIQADISTVRRYGGTGLGLSITKLLLELMNSQIQVESTVGKGSTFYFTLPVEIVREEVACTEEKALATQGYSTGKLQILIVEDSEINRLVLMQFLQLWGDFQADQADNGEIALKMSKENTYDLILMDVRMPVMDGYQAAEAIREDVQNPNADIPIIALTADTPGELKKRPQFQYFTDILTKPFEPEELRNKILRASARYRKESSKPKENMVERKGVNGDKVTDINMPSADLKKVIELFKGNAEGINRLIQSAMSDYYTFSREYSEALLKRELGAMQEYVHKRKPILELLGLRYVSERLSAIRKLVSKGVDDKELQLLNKESGELLSRVITSLNLELNKFLEQSER